MTDKKKVLTPEGLEKLQQELHKLKAVDRPAVIKRIAEARELGDLSENADYQDAREQQSFIDGRIQELEDLIKNSDIVSNQEYKDVVQLASRVKVMLGQQEVEYEIVGSNEADPLQGKISVESPVGSALLGRRKNDEFIISTPGGEIKCRIIAVN